MSELITINEVGANKRKQYEELLLKRDQVQKEAFAWGQSYIREFGEEILKVFEKKIACIRLKKLIAYCQANQNRGQSVSYDDLMDYLAVEMSAYEQQVEEMIQENQAAKSARQITESEYLEIKRIYRRIVKKIHPDINPNTESNLELAELWQRVMIAYNCNNIKELRELEVLVNISLERMGVGDETFEIPDLDEKIAELLSEIETIKSTDPYRYSELLSDDVAVAQKHEELAEELAEYEAYERELERIASNFHIMGGSSCQTS